MSGKHNGVGMANEAGLQSALNPVRHRRRIAEIPFAGRIGGNQEFTVSQDSSDAESVLEKQPDAAPLSNISDSFRLSGFLNLDLWRQAVIEGWGTCLLVFALGGAASGLTRLPISLFAGTLYAALLNGITLILFIFAAGPASGGHLNPTITLATFFAGLSTFPRTVLYVTAQCTGAIVGAYWLRLGSGDAYYFESVCSYSGDIRKAQSDFLLSSGHYTWLHS